MHIVAFLIAILAAITVLLLSFFSLISKRFQFWPPPDYHSWQHRVFMLLFRLTFYGLLALSWLDYNSQAILADPIRFYLGLPLIIIGFGLAFYLTGYLGWKNAFGEGSGLKTEGWYRYSRNPIYVVSMLGMIGWALFINSLLVDLVLLLWLLMYVAAPFVEEPWLEDRYGDEYLLYKKQVPRYFGLRKNSI